MKKGIQHKPYPQWINRLLDCCEEAGISKETVELFNKLYISPRADENTEATTDGTSKGIQAK